MRQVFQDGGGRTSYLPQCVVLYCVCHAWSCNNGGGGGGEREAGVVSRWRRHGLVLWIVLLLSRTDDDYRGRMERWKGKEGGSDEGRQVDGKEG